MVTERQAREWLDEIRTVRPRKRLGRTLFELRPDGLLDVYTMNRALSRMWFMHKTNPAVEWMHPDVRAWYLNMWTDGAWLPLDPREDPSSPLYRRLS